MTSPWSHVGFFYSSNFFFLLRYVNDSVIGPKMTLRPIHTLHLQCTDFTDTWRHPSLKTSWKSSVANTMETRDTLDCGQRNVDGGMWHPIHCLAECVWMKQTSEAVRLHRGLPYWMVHRYKSRAAAANGLGSGYYVAYAKGGKEAFLSLIFEFFHGSFIWFYVGVSWEYILTSDTIPIFKP